MRAQPILPLLLLLVAAPVWGQRFVSEPAAEARHSDPKTYHLYAWKNSKGTSLFSLFGFENAESFGSLPSEAPYSRKVALRGVAAIKQNIETIPLGSILVLVGGIADPAHSFGGTQIGFSSRSVIAEIRKYAEARKIVVRGPLPRYVVDWSQRIPDQLRIANAPKTARKIDCFRSLNRKMSMFDVVRKCGIPDDQGGSGIAIFMYYLDDGSNVAIGTGNLDSIFYVVHGDRLGHSTSLLPKE